MAKIVIFLLILSGTDFIAEINMPRLYFIILLKGNNLGNLGALANRKKGCML